MPFDDIGQRTAFPGDHVLARVKAETVHVSEPVHW
jgi:hypothetical protein